MPDKRGGELHERLSSCVPGASQKDPGKKMFTFSRPGNPAETVTGQP